MPYAVYENFRQDSATVHLVTCRHYKKKGGVSQAERPSGQWHDGLQTLKRAWEVAAQTQREAVKGCLDCLGRQRFRYCS